MLLYKFLCLYLIATIVHAEVTTSGYTYMSNPLTLTTAAQLDKTRNVTDAVVNTSTTSKPDSPTNESSSIQNSVGCTGSCMNLSASCYNCSVNFTNNCIYGDKKNFTCEVKDEYECTGNRTVTQEFKCIYCYLMQADVDYTCEQTNTSCDVTATPPQRVKMNCTVNDNVFCLGRRKFSKMTYCNWTSGYKWSTALILSITLGGFGVDRFYLGYWREGLGKLFSFGGLGVWTLIDIVLIGASYLGPSDGSIYIY